MGDGVSAKQVPRRSAGDLQLFFVTSNFSVEFSKQVCYNDDYK